MTCVVRRTSERIKRKPFIQAGYGGHMPVIWALERWRQESQEDPKFKGHSQLQIECKTSLGYMRTTKMKKKERKRWRGSEEGEN